MDSATQRLRVGTALALTLLVLSSLSDRLLISGLLLGLWWVLFRPIRPTEAAMFAVAAFFFLMQNYASLRAGLFAFRFQDVLLMPYYEPLLWGFYFLALKRFVGEPGSAAPLSWRAVAGLTVTSLAFSLSGPDPRTVLATTAASTGLLLILFHELADLWWAGAALALGFVVELFGTSIGLWTYPAPDFLGVPYWFVTMWTSAGVLGRRFLVPVSEWLAGRLLRSARVPTGR